MSLSKRQKRRLVELCQMIDSSSAVETDISKINFDNIEELSMILNRINSGDQVPDQRISPSTDCSLGFPNSAKQEPKNDVDDDDTPKLGKDAAESVPNWAKSLYKRIMLKCHPDRVQHQQLSVIEGAHRRSYLLLAQKAYGCSDWNKVLYIGIRLHEFTNDLSHASQYNILSEDYNRIAQRISNIQNSLAWKWGEEWNNIDARIIILTHLLQIQKIPAPSRSELIKIIVNLETD